MAKRKTLEEKIAEDLAKLDGSNTEEDIVVDFPEKETNIWANLTIVDEEPKESENAAELKDDDFSSASLDVDIDVDVLPKPTIYKINENKDSGLNTPVVTAPTSKLKTKSKNAVRGIYYLNGKIGRN